MAEAKKKSNAVPAAPKDNPEAAVKDQTAPVELKQPLRAKPKDFRRSEVVEVRQTLYAEPATNLVDPLQPDFWTHVSDMIVPMSHITVINKAEGWEQEYRVLQVANKLVKVAKLRETHWGDRAGSEEFDRLKARYSTQYRSDGWRVTDTDGNQVAAGLGSEAEAQKFIDQLVMSMAA